MKFKKIEKLAKKIGKVEKQLLGELFLAENINHLVAFTQTYISNYLPILYYAVKNLDSNQVAGLMNTSILIDRLLRGRINDAVRFEVQANVTEFIENHSLEEDTIIRLMSRQTNLTKANLSTHLLFINALFRNSMFALSCEKKLTLNYGISWNNLFSQFVQNPHLIYLLDNSCIILAEKQLRLIEKELAKKNGELATEIKDALLSMEVCKKKELSKVKIYFLGIKLQWLMGKTLVYYCKFLKNNNKRDLSMSIRYSKKVLQFLESEDYSYHKDSFNKRLSNPGPSPDVKMIMGELKQYEISRIFNFIGCFRSEAEIVVIVFPTDLEFYFEKSLAIKNDKGISLLTEYEPFLIGCHNQGFFSLFEHYSVITKPHKSSFYSNWQKLHSILKAYSKYGLSKSFINNLLAVEQETTKLNKLIEKRIDHNRLIANALVVTSIIGLNHFAEARGLTKIPEYLSTTMVLVIDILTKSIYESKYEEFLKSATNEDEEIVGFFDLEDDEHLSLEALEKKIEVLEDSCDSVVKIMELEGLQEIIKVNKKLRILLKSTKPIEEINTVLRHIYDSIK